MVIDYDLRKLKTDVNLILFDLISFNEQESIIK